MGRIRTVKPEYPQAESVGRLSRDARLLDILLKTVADDEGRTRGASRMLASLLYPYDEDAPSLIEGWLDELEHERRIRRYVVDGYAYLQLTKFLEDEKIDRPSRSKLPPPPNAREDLANAREKSLRTKDQGPKDQGEDREHRKGSLDSVDARILCESIGIFPIREQEDVHRLMVACAQKHKLTGEQVIERIQARCDEYDRETNLEWKFGSRYKFLMSGKWDAPNSWPRSMPKDGTRREAEDRWTAYTAQLGEEESNEAA